MSKGTHFLWVLICALALVIGLATGHIVLAEQNTNTQPSTNFRPDYPLTEIRGKAFKEETVQLDGNNFVDCTFNNVVLKFDGQAPFSFTNDHFTGKFSLTSSNPVVKTTIELMDSFIKAGNAAQPR